MKYVIVGLGNIGEEYVNTRHNAGFVVLDAMIVDTEIKFEPARLASVARTRLRGKQLILVKPSTYMNNSGKAVRYWLNKENVPIERCLIIVDDIALPLGTLRMRKKGSDAGHNGMISVIEYLNTNEFPRLRVGIGNEFHKGYQVDYVLGEWSKNEEEMMVPRIKLAVEMVQSFVFRGVDYTMNHFNNK